MVAKAHFQLAFRLRETAIDQRQKEPDVSCRRRIFFRGDYNFGLRSGH
jgi:hypothetical protein